MNLRKYLLFLFLFASVLVAAASETNYFCLVCGKGPLSGHIWLHPRGAICDDCEKIQDRCSICGLPVRDGYAKTADGRFICKYDRPNAVLSVADAKEIFTATRSEVVGMLGRSFALEYPEVTVNVFDVDYWSEKGRKDGLHKFGFSLTRKEPGGKCIHTVVLLSGRLRTETTATAAHEYTHLWINENRPASHVIDPDTMEAICELTAYKFMGEKNLPQLQKAILESPYTNGKIKTLVAVEQERGIGYIFNWVKNSTNATLETESPARIVAHKPAMAGTNIPPALPRTFKFSGLLVIGNSKQAMVNGVAFAAGDEKQIKLRNKTVLVRCREIQDASVVLELDGSHVPFVLKKGEEKLPP